MANKPELIEHTGGTQRNTEVDVAAVAILADHTFRLVTGLEHKRAARRHRFWLRPSGACAPGCFSFENRPRCQSPPRWVASCDSSAEPSRAQRRLIIGSRVRCTSIARKMDECRESPRE